MKKYSFLLVLVAVAIVNFLQSASTELLQDEAYYWLYSQYLNWGYFDHPPVVALYIYISDFFFDGELGVRFLSGIMYSLTVALLWRVIEIEDKKKYQNLFLLVTLSTFLFNVYGFITVPDTPMLFFMALFLIAYKNILKTDDWQNYILLAFSIAGLLYSKYTGLLVVVFAILANLKLLTKVRFWVSIAIAILLFTPHIWWQVVNDFPSVRYHLFERSSNRVYRFDYTSMHFVNQIAIIGFTFPIVYKAFYKNLKNSDAFQRGLNFIVIGLIAFFFLMSFKGPTQAQWTVPITFPLIIITFYYLTTNNSAKKTFTILAIVNLVVITGARIVMANDLLPVQLEMHGNKNWVSSVQKAVDGKKVIFQNSYQNAGLYSFYTGEISPSYNSYDARKSQFNVWNLQEDFTNQEVVVFDQGKRAANYTIPKKKDVLYGNTIQNFIPVDKLYFEISTISENKCEVSIYNPYKKPIALESLESILIFKDKENKTIGTATAKFNDAKMIAGESTSYTTLYFETKRDHKKIDHFEIAIRNNSKMAFQKVN